MENDSTTRRIVVTTTIDNKTKRANRNKNGNQNQNAKTQPRIIKSNTTGTEITTAESKPEAEKEPSTLDTTKQKEAEKEPAQTGGQPQKVILTKKKKHTKVILGTPKMVVPKKQQKTMKHIKLHTKGITRRITRAKLITKSLAAKNLDVIKKELVEAKLVKVDTKAPENVLRQIYTDYMLMKGKAL
jgi:hypothetical protein